MKMYKTTHGIDVPVSNEEITVLEKLSKPTSEESLTQRDILLAERLVKRGVLECKYIKSKAHFALSTRSK